jgi:hypothetical protein
MVRRTSSEAYQQIEADGLLSYRRWVTYKYLFEYGPCTANELQHKVKINKGINGAEFLMSLDKRLSELRNVGVVREAGQRRCTISGKNNIVWEIVPGALPVKKPEATKKRCPHCKGKGFLIQERLL